MTLNMTSLKSERRSAFFAGLPDNQALASILWNLKRAKATLAIAAAGDETLWGAELAVSEDEAFALTDAYASAADMDDADAGDKVKAPYGNQVHYCDNNMRGDGKKRFPVNTKERAKAAWSYSHHASIMSKYTAAQLSRLHSCIASAYKKFFGEAPQSGS